jgi:ATP-dependent protease HslVU (ClpYQ) peptidase subunit
MTYLDYLAEELRKKENNYVERAVELLRSTMTRETASEAMMVISKEKAQSMASQLKNMVTPAMMSKVTRIG